MGQNSTSAKIEPRSLLPTTFFGQPTGGKIVDFVVHLKSDSEMLQKMRDLASIDINNSPFSINHTRHSPLRFQPIAINIETKTTGTAWDEAMVQSSIWVASQFNRLTQLVKMVGGNGDEIPEIPLIIIQGHNWNFLAARRDQAGHAVSSILRKPRVWTFPANAIHLVHLSIDYVWNHRQSAGCLPSLCRLISTFGMGSRCLSTMVPDQGAGSRQQLDKRLECI
jgi:hypothetical protein